MSGTLTKREQQVVNLAIQAKRNKQIAYELGIAIGTVRIYLSNIYRKLGVGSKSELILRFSRSIADI